MKDKKLEVGLIGGKEKRTIRLVDYDEGWPVQFQKHQKLIQDALGKEALGIEHIGSTAVPGLSAKPIIDILLIVKDAGDESKYLDKMESVGYHLRVREPDFHNHRMFRTAYKEVHLHVLSVGCTEIDRYLVFRNYLRLNDVARKEYEITKRNLASVEWEDMNEYASAKTHVVERIIKAGFANLNNQKEITDNFK